MDGHGHEARELIRVVGGRGRSLPRPQATDCGRRARQRSRVAHACHCNRYCSLNQMKTPLIPTKNTSPAQLSARMAAPGRSAWGVALEVMSRKLR